LCAVGGDGEAALALGVVAVIGGRVALVEDGLQPAMTVVGQGLAAVGGGVAGGVVVVGGTVGTADV